MNNQELETNLLKLDTHAYLLSQIANVTERTAVYEELTKMKDITKLEFHIRWYMYLQKETITEGDTLLLNEYTSLLFEVNTHIKNETKTNLQQTIMNVHEAAERWNLSPSYVKDLCAKEKIAAEKIGKTWVIAREQINPRFNIFNNK